MVLNRLVESVPSLSSDSTTASPRQVRLRVPEVDLLRDKLASPARTHVVPLSRSIRLAPATLLVIVVIVIRQIGIIPHGVDPAARARGPFRHGDPQHLDNLLVRVGGLWSQVIEHAEVVLVFDAVGCGWGERPGIAYPISAKGEVGAIQNKKNEGEETEKVQEQDEGSGGGQRAIVRSPSFTQVEREKHKERQRARTHLGSAPASSNIPITPCFAAGLSNLTARCNGVARSRRFCKSTSVSSKSSRSESASGEGVAALRRRAVHTLVSIWFALYESKGIRR